MFLNKLQDYVYLESTFKKLNRSKSRTAVLNYVDVNFCHSSRSARSVSISYQSVNKISPTTPLINSRCHVNKALFETVLPKQIRPNAFVASP